MIHDKVLERITSKEVVDVFELVHRLTQNDYGIGKDWGGRGGSVIEVLVVVILGLWSERDCVVFRDHDWEVVSIIIYFNDFKIGTI